MPAEPERSVPEGAAVFPQIPPELGVHPLLLAVIHATVFLAGSDDDLVNAEAADEAIECMAEYLQRLRGVQLRQVREDMECLVKYARRQHWPKQLVRAVQTFLTDYRIGSEGEA
jgi:hypothetical protein